MAETTPREIDTRIAELATEAARCRREARSQAARSARNAHRWPSEALDADRRAVEMDARAVALEAEMRPLHDAYCANPWPRWFRCDHLHTSTACHTLRPTSAVYWLPALSGRDAADVVAEFGSDVCTVCVPEAPTMPQPRVSPTEALRAAGRAERDAKRAAREAKAAANALVEPVTVGGRFKERIATVTAAWTEISHVLPYALGLSGHRNPEHEAECRATVATLRAALERKLGADAVAERMARAEKRVRREWAR